MKLWIGNPTFDVLPLPWEICSPFNNSWLRKTRHWKYISFIPSFSSPYFFLHTNRGRKWSGDFKKIYSFTLQGFARRCARRRWGWWGGRCWRSRWRPRWTRRGASRCPSGTVASSCCAEALLLSIGSPGVFYWLTRLSFSTYSIDKYFNVLHLESKSFH